ncbi:MAG: hypothetical protein H0V82_08745 [Candidatus Protochlamydia sp.]|nr:hypothetical protein [Candidatus Protochlamydia sp.]
MSEFPVLAEFNQLRTYLSHHSHLKAEDELFDLKTIQASGNWVAHKVMTVVCLPLNTAGIVGGSIACLATMALVGGTKLAINLFSMGKCKLPFPTGTKWLFVRVCSATAEIFNNIGELLYDVYDIGYQGFRVMRWVFSRIWIGLEKANEKESGLTLREQILFPRINNAARAYRIDERAEDRSFASIAKHTSFSLFNIPVSSAVALSSGAIAVPFFSAIYLTKALIYAGTNLHIPFPTYVGKSLEVSYYAGREAAIDGIDIGRDVYISAYKISSIFRFNVIATVRDVILYIPEALFDINYRDQTDGLTAEA